MLRGTRRIVAIDYDASIGQRLRTAFQGPEYDLHWFADGREALDRLHEIRPDVIVCDLMLPGLDGRAVLESVRRSPALRNVPFLVLSGVRSEATIRATLDAGAQAFLVKPCPISQLKQTIQKVLEETAQEPEADLGEAPRRLQVEGLRLIPSGIPGAAADDPADSDRLAPAGEAPIVSEGRVSRLDLDGARFQIQTVAEGGPQEVVLTTTVTSGGQELRRAESRLACEDATTLKDLLDAQHARALEATRHLQAQGRLTGPLGRHPVEPQNASDSLLATPPGAAVDQPPAPAEGPEAEAPPPPLRPATAPVRKSVLARIDVPPKTPRARSMPRKQAPPAVVAPGTVLMNPAQGKEPPSPETEILQPRKQPEPAPLALDTVLLEEGSQETPPSAAGREILTEYEWPPPRRTLWYYLPRVAAALLGLGVLAILLEGPSDTVPPESAPAVSPEPVAPSTPIAKPSATATALATPKASPPAARSPTPTATPAAALAVAPIARPSASPPAAEPSARASVEPAPEPQPAQERSAQMVRGRLQWAQALYDKGRYDEARTALNEVFKLAPANAQARQLATQLERSVAGMAPSAGADGAPEEDHRAVLALLGRYETALENGDVTSLQVVWPSVDPQEVRERRQSLRSWELALRLIDLEVTGDQAVALCVSYDDMLTTEGERIENSSRVSFHLRRENGSWIIEAVK